MGRPLKKKLFGAPSASTNTIKVQFHNGTASVKGYIVEQLGSKKFTCKDADGNTATCKLVAKASASLAAGEMTITVKYDNGTASQITKIADRVVTVDGVKMPWTFDTSTTDGKVQMEEAGDDTSFTNATDLEGDDGPTLPFGMDRNAPLPGSGTWATATGAGVPSYALRGSLVADPGGAVTTVPGTPASGLYRQKYIGAPFTGANVTGSYSAAFFTNPLNGPISTADHEVDTYIGFGQRDDLGYEDGYAFEWKGYLKVPVSGNYNTFISCDDDVAFWIGSAALAPTGSNVFHKQPYVNANAAGGCTNSVTLDATKWYPVRIWFTEFGGSERFQFFMNNSANATKYGYNGTSTDLLWSYNTVTKGY
jgi:hypothetical protein